MEVKSLVWGALDRVACTLQGQCNREGGSFTLLKHQGEV
jgi:hypothetical protein